MPELAFFVFETSNIVKKYEIEGQFYFCIFYRIFAGYYFESDILYLKSIELTVN